MIELEKLGSEILPFSIGIIILFIIKKIIRISLSGKLLKVEPFIDYSFILAEVIMSVKIMEYILVAFDCYRNSSIVISLIFITLLIGMINV